MSNYNLTHEEAEVLNLIKQGQTYRSDFFRRATKFKWFHHLEKAGFFKATQNPEPVPVESEGWRIPYWDVLDYLKKLAIQAHDEPNSDIADALIDLIADVGTYRRPDGKCIDNFHTWSAFISILAKMPFEKISVELLRNISDWLETRFDSMSITHGIIEELLPHLLTGARSGPDESIQKVDSVMSALLTWDEVAVTPDGSTVSLLQPKYKLRADAYWIEKAFRTDGLGARLAAANAFPVIELVADNLSTLLHRRTPGARFVVRTDNENLEVYIVETGQSALKAFFRPTVFKYPAGEPLTREELEQSDFVSAVLSLPKDEDLFSYPELLWIALCNEWPSEYARFKGSLSRENVFRAYHNVYEDYSEVWLRDISSLEMRHLKDPDHVHMLALKYLIEGWAKENPDGLGDVIQLLSSFKYQHNFFRRLLLHAYNLNWPTYSNEFKQLISSDSSYMWFSLDWYKPELYHLLEQIPKRAGSDLLESLKTALDHDPMKRSWSDEPDSDAFKNYRKQFWYSAVSAHPLFKNEFIRLREETGTDIEVDFRSSSMVIGPGEPHLNTNEILEIDRNTVLVKKLSSLKTEDSFRGPNLNADGEHFEAAVVEKPEKYTSDIDPFLSAHYFYQYHLLAGLTKVASDNRPLDWPKIIIFVGRLFENERFWTDNKPLEGEDYGLARDAVIGNAAWLIQEGCQTRANAIPSDQLPACLDIYLNAWKRWSPVNIDYSLNAQLGPINDISNMSTGKHLRTIIALNLAIARGSQTKLKAQLEDAIDDGVKELFAELISDGRLDAITMFGWHVPQFRWLDCEWTDSVTESLSTTEDDLTWAVFSYSFLFGVAGYIELYSEYPKVYDRLLKSHNWHWDSLEIATSHVCTGYMLGVKGFEFTGFMGMLVEDWRPAETKEVIRCLMLHHYQGGLKPDQSEPSGPILKVHEFWDKLYTEFPKTKEELSEDQQDILSAVADLSCFLGALDRDTNLQWLIQSAPHAQRNYRMSNLVEQLDRLKDVGSDEVANAEMLAEILVAMTSIATPEYDQPEFLSLCRFIGEHADQEGKKRLHDVRELLLRRDQTWIRSVQDPLE